MLKKMSNVLASSERIGYEQMEKGQRAKLCLSGVYACVCVCVCVCVYMLVCLCVHMNVEPFTR